MIRLAVVGLSLAARETLTEPLLISSRGVRPRTSDISRMVDNSDSRSRMLVLTFSAMYSMASSSISAPSRSALARRIAHLSSNLGS